MRSGPLTVARKIKIPSPKRSTQISVTLLDLFLKPCIYLGPKIIPVRDTTHLLQGLFLAFLRLPSTGKVFILIVLIKIFIIVFFLVIEKEILVLI